MTISKLSKLLILYGFLSFRILNKLSPEKFDKLSLELLNVGIESQVILKGIILLVSNISVSGFILTVFCIKITHRLLGVSLTQLHSALQGKVDGWFCLFSI